MSGAPRSPDVGRRAAGAAEIGARSACESRDGVELKVYFAGAIRGGRDDADGYRALIGHIATRARVLTEHVGAPADDAGESLRSDREIHARDLRWLQESDALIAEVTQPSLGVGYELGRAEALGKPILCLHHRRPGARLSAMIAGSPHPELLCYDTLDEATLAIDRFLARLR